MARHFKEVPNVPPTEDASNDQRKTPAVNVPTVEDGGVADSTVASPALGFGMDRIDFLDTRTPESNRLETSLPRIEDEDSGVRRATGTLARNEVAAISADRSFYVSDVPTPYLSSKQAREDVRVTRRRHGRISVILVTLLLAVVLGGGGWLVWNSLQTPERTAVAQHETCKIEHGEYLESIETTSLVRPANEVVVTANVSGRVAEVCVEDGTDVQEGDLLFRLDNPTITEAAKKAQESFDAFSKEVEKKQEAANKANEAVAKAQEAADKAAEAAAKAQETTTTEKSGKDAAAKAALEQAQNNATVAQNELDAANNNLWNLQETLNNAQEQERNLNVYAPITGKVSELTSSTSISGSTPLCNIADTSSLSLLIEIPASEEKRVKVGQEVRLSFPSLEDEELHITSSVSAIDTNEDKLIATVIIESPDERLSPGLAAEACLVLKSIPDAYIVPVETLRTDEKGIAHLDVLLDPSRDIITDVSVKVLATDGTRAAIQADNIQAGNTVLIAGTSDATEAAKE